MKKLKKLLINYEKLMNSDELRILKGGDGPATCCCFDLSTYCCYGILLSEEGDCETDCKYAFGPNASGNPGNCGPYCRPCGIGYGY
jgi:hypothetical protein